MVCGNIVYSLADTIIYVTSGNNISCTVPCYTSFNCVDPCITTTLADKIITLDLRLRPWDYLTYKVEIRVVFTNSFTSFTRSFVVYVASCADNTMIGYTKPDPWLSM